MTITAKTDESKPDVNAHFYEKAGRALKELFEKAKAANELHFAMALMPEMRGMQDGGWNTAEEASDAYGQFTELLDNLAADDIVRVRVLLALYLHTAECSGFYEVPKKMLLTCEGKGNSYLPFQKLVKKNRKTGQAIAPNANTIMKDLMGHSWLLGFHELSAVFEEAFDADVRNAIAHADYTIERWISGTEAQWWSGAHHFMGGIRPSDGQGHQSFLDHPTYRRRIRAELQPTENN